MWKQFSYNFSFPCNHGIWLRCRGYSAPYCKTEIGLFCITWLQQNNAYEKHLMTPAVHHKHKYKVPQDGHHQNGCQSNVQSSRKLKAGVLQGSVLGLMVFNIYVHGYADDLAILLRNPSWAADREGLSVNMNILSWRTYPSSSLLFRPYLQSSTSPAKKWPVKWT